LRSTQGDRAGRSSHVLTLLRVGFAEPSGSPRALVRSCRTVSPLPVVSGRWPGPNPSAVCSLWHFPADRSDWLLASTLPYGVPTFLDQVTTQEGDAWPRPPSRLTVAINLPGRPRRRPPCLPACAAAPRGRPPACAAAPRGRPPAAARRIEAPLRLQWPQTHGGAFWCAESNADLPCARKMGRGTGDTADRVTAWGDTRGPWRTRAGLARGSAKG
jgi:hypothetical protein